MRFAQKLRLRSCHSHKITSITLIAATETNCDCTHTIYTQSKNYAYTHVTHSTYKPISPPTIALKPYKTKRFTAKSQDFLSFLHTNNNQTNPEQCRISSETTLKSQGKTHRKSIFKSQNHIEKHTGFEQSVKKHRKAVKHSKFFYKN